MTTMIYIVIATDKDGYDVPIKAFTSERDAEELATEMDNESVTNPDSHWRWAWVRCIELVTEAQQ